MDIREGSKINIFYKTLSILLIIFIVPSSLQGISLFKMFPKIFGVLLVICIVIIYLKNITKINIIILFLVVSLGTCSMLVSNNIGLNMKDSMYFITFILMAISIGNKGFINIIEGYLITNKYLIRNTIILMHLILIISILSDNTYYNGWNQNDKYLMGFTPMPHVIAGICFCLLLLIIFYIKLNNWNKKLNVLLILPTVSIFMTGARTYLIPLILVLGFYFFIIMGKRKFTKYCFIVSPIIILILINSTMFDKFIYTINFQHGNQSIISRLTSARSDIWSGLIYEYKNSYNLLEKLVGVSFDNVYNLVRSHTGMNVWAHNDIVNTLMSSGILGVVTYLCAYFRTVYCYINRYSYRHSKAIFLFIYSFFLLTNGLFISAPLMISMILFWVIFSESEDKINKAS